MSTKLPKEVVQAVDDLNAWLLSVSAGSNNAVTTGGTSITSSVSSSADIALLRELEKKLNTSITQIRTVLNSCPPVNRLPPEILQRIILLTAGSMPDHSPFANKIILPKPNDSPYSWSLYAGVCRYWRSVIESLPVSKWSEIYIPAHTPWSPALLTIPRKCLQKSGNKPLDIHYGIEIYDQTLLAFQDRVFRQMNRVRSVYLDGEVVMPIYLSRWDRPAPLLEKLTIEPEDPPIALTADWPLPPLFDGHAPRLRHLNVKYYLPWGDNSFTALTHLCLHAAGKTRPYKQADFFNFLAENKSLQELVLINVRLLKNSAKPTLAPQSIGRQLSRVLFQKCHPDVVEGVTYHVQPLPSATILIDYGIPRKGFAYMKTTPPPNLAHLACVQQTRYVRLRPVMDAKRNILHVELTGAGNSGPTFGLFPGIVNGLYEKLPSSMMKNWQACPAEELDITFVHIILKTDLLYRTLQSFPGIRRLSMHAHVPKGTSQSLDALFNISRGALPAADLPCPSLEEIVIRERPESKGEKLDATIRNSLSGLQTYITQRTVTLNRRLRIVVVREDVQRDTEETIPPSTFGLTNEAGIDFAQVGKDRYAGLGCDELESEDWDKMWFSLNNRYDAVLISSDVD